jgi:hypothetical protein
MLHAGLLRGILFAHEKGSEIFLRNFIWFSTQNIALYPRK